MLELGIRRLTPNVSSQGPQALIFSIKHHFLHNLPWQTEPTGRVVLRTVDPAHRRRNTLGKRRDAYKCKQNVEKRPCFWMQRIRLYTAFYITLEMESKDPIVVSQGGRADEDRVDSPCPYVVLHSCGILRQPPQVVALK